MTEVRPIPEPNPEILWRHYKGATYRVLAIANRDTTDHTKYPVMVVYQNTVNHTIWARRADDWHRSFRRDDGSDGRKCDMGRPFDIFDPSIS